MSSSLKNASFLFAGIAALTFLPSNLLAQFPDRGSLENYQSGSGQGKKCSGHHPGVPASREARLRAAKRQDAASQLRTVASVTPITMVQQPENPEDVANRQLNLARELKAEADVALQSKDAARALKLRDRVEDRLTQLIAKYSDTEAASQATVLLKQFRDK
jgi:hypothetical protein